MFRAPQHVQVPPERRQSVSLHNFEISYSVHFN